MRLNFVFPDKLVVAFKERCKKNGWSMTKIVETLIEVFNIGIVDDVLKDQWTIEASEQSKAETRSE